MLFADWLTQRCVVYFMMMSYIPYHLENQLRNRLIVEWVHLLLRTRLSDGVILFSSSWLAKCLIALSTIVAATIPSSNRFSAKDKVVGLMVFSTRILYISWCCVITLSSPFFLWLYNQNGSRFFYTCTVPWPSLYWPMFPSSRWRPFNFVAPGKTRPLHLEINKLKITSPDKGKFIY